MSSLLNASLAENTKEAYSVGIHAFEQFMITNLSDQIWPPPLPHVLVFIAHISASKHAPSTARTYLSGLAFRCKLLGAPDVTQNFLVKKLLSEMAGKKCRVDTRLPITPAVLQKRITALPITCTNQEATLFAAIFSVAFFCFFIIGELILTGKPPCQQVLQMSNVNFKEGGTLLDICLNRSKTDQLGLGAVISLPASHSQLCPVRLLKSYVARRPNFTGPLFCHFGGSPVTRYQFNAVLKKSLLAIGVDVKKYKSHSFRIGAATTASIQGISDEKIKELGRWESKAYKTYIRVPTEQLQCH